MHLLFLRTGKTRSRAFLVWLAVLRFFFPLLLVLDSVCKRLGMTGVHIGRVSWLIAFKPGIHCENKAKGQ